MLGAWVVISKLALVAPAGTITVEGTAATPGLLLESATPAPSGGAGRVRLTLPVIGPPPTTGALGTVSARSRMGGRGNEIKKSWPESVRNASPPAAGPPSCPQR